MHAPLPPAHAALSALSVFLADASLLPRSRRCAELTPGCRLQLLGDQFVRNNGGEAIVVSATDRLWRYRLRLDSGSEMLVRLDSERFRLLRFDRMLNN